MWSFTKRTSLVESGIFQGFTDWHCHLLPSVDDGIQTMEESLQTLILYEKLGIREVWFTPHIMEDMPNTTAHLHECFVALCDAYRGNMKLYLAAEYMLDSLFEERLKDDDLLPLGKDKNHLLVETSYFNPPMDLSGIFDRIKAKGYYPILAHPERYIYMEEEDYRLLKGKDIKFQLNLFSLTSAYGKSAKAKAKWLIKNSFYDLIGTDTHRFSVFDEMKEIRLTSKATSTIISQIKDKQLI